MSSSSRSGTVKILAIILAFLMVGSIISGLFYAIAAGL